MEPEMILFSEILERITNKSPITALTRASMEYALRQEDLDEVFNNVAKRQYTRTLLFSAMVSLMSLVVSKSRKSVRAAYLKLADIIGVDLQSVYNKLDNLETNVSRSLVQHVSSQLTSVIDQMENGAHEEWLPGYRVKILDGNHLASTDHRIAELREKAAGPLPGFVLAIYDPRLDLVIDVICNEDGHAQERSLTAQILEIVNKNDLWIDDRNFCTTALLFGINIRDAFFVTRQHKINVRWSSAGPEKRCGETNNGLVFQEPVYLFDDNNNTISARRIIVKIKGTTRNGDKEISILTNLPDEIPSEMVARLYQKRWTIERLFQELERGLNGEINTLGYPKAALFAFCIALCSYNIYSIVKASIRAAFGEKIDSDDISDYRIATEVESVFGGVDIMTEKADWETFFQNMTSKRICLLASRNSKKLEILYS
jgi:hypothetical protein